MFWAKFSDQDRIRIPLKFFGADRIIKFQYPHNTDLYPKTAWECFVLHNTHFCTVLWNLSYIFHMHTFKQALINPLCFEGFVVYHKFVHVKAIDIFWSNSLIGRLCALISLLRFYKSNPFKFFRNSTNVSITGHVTVIWSPVAKIALGYCSVCCGNSRYGEVVLMHLL